MVKTVYIYMTSFAIGILCFVIKNGVYCELTNMKIVDEPSSYGLNNGIGNYYPQQETLKMKVRSANFSGPDHLLRLKGKCFSKVIESYKYELCLFSNVTQYEQSLRWNPYSGVLGIWQEWEMTNNTFIAMVMRNGDDCGDKARLVKVFLQCGNKSEILNVTEPFTCEYHLIFQTVLVCHPDAMLVYPTLTHEEREAWDDLETRLANNELTLKGYQNKLHNVLEKAGLYLSKDEKDLLVIKQGEKSTQLQTGDNNNNYRFFTLDKCSKEYEKLELENERLKKVLSDHNIKDEHIILTDLDNTVGANKIMATNSTHVNVENNIIGKDNNTITSQIPIIKEEIRNKNNQSHKNA